MPTAINMNRKKDKGFESPSSHVYIVLLSLLFTTHQVVCINNINFQRKSVIVSTTEVTGYLTLQYQI
uniref:Uncharacterized protein n=1 Tax=Sander lucioperca TaxID=283035 RepID=A0A8D0CXL7_SANLU